MKIDNSSSVKFKNNQSRISFDGAKSKQLKTIMQFQRKEYTDSAKKTVGLIGIFAVIPGGSLLLPSICLNFKNCINKFKIMKNLASVTPVELLPLYKRAERRKIFNPDNLKSTLLKFYKERLCVW